MPGELVASVLQARSDALIIPVDSEGTVTPAMLEQVLKDAGKPYEFVVLPGEDHWLSLGSTRLQMLKAAVSFVEKHNPPE